MTTIATETKLHTPAEATNRRTGLSSLFGALVRTQEGATPVILRLGLALVIFPHGAQKLLGWFGGYGFEGTMGYMTSAAGLPWIVAFLVVLGEFFGPILLAVGALTRFAAASIGIIMLGAITTAHASYGFFMNWSGQQAGEGFEYHLLAITLALALMVRGAGSGSIDRLLTRRIA